MTLGAYTSILDRTSLRTLRASRSRASLMSIICASHIRMASSPSWQTYLRTILAPSLMWARALAL